ncbi:MAG: pyruvate formate lyase family protein [Clostridiaceae bacterium]|nr:pyruvate formate lyase family protein [Clostridiaceae bacterium]
MAYDGLRIERLRQKVLDQDGFKARSDEGQLLWFRGWLNCAGASSHLLRRAEARAYQMEHSTPVIDEDELLVGKPCFRPLDPAEQAELRFDLDKLSPMLPQTDGQASHMAIDYEKLLRLGIEGLESEIADYRGRLDPDRPADIAKDQFYQSCLRVLEGLAAYADHYANYAGALAASSPEPRRSELLEIAAVCRRVPRRPAASFREALQAIHFVTFCLEGLYQYGRPDRYLLPYYEQDIRAGLITEDAAQELIDCLCILLNMFTGKGLAVGLMVGGRDAGGRDVCNSLTRLFLKSIGHTRLAYPGIGLCYTEDTPAELLDLSCRLLGQGYSHPALFNDATISRGLRGYGLPPEEACLYIHSTCVEITPIASSAVWVASPYINLVQILLEIMADQNTGVDTFTGLLSAWRNKLRGALRQEIRQQNLWQMERERHGGDPLVSCFVNDCLERGLDVDQGGARYNWIMPSFVGLANLADSLLAIRQLVYEQKKLSLGEFNQILAANFQNHEDLRQIILNQIPKYGNDLDSADDLVGLITGWIAEETDRLRTWRGSRVVPSLFCWIMHEHFGSRTGASPDGRTGGFPLGDGSGPAQGREHNGPTASVLSSTKWPHDRFIGGIAVNMKFSGRLFTDRSRVKMIALIRTFMDRGGFELQINVVDRATLLKAKEHPDEYRDLVVRVGGYSDYFVRLSPAMQDEVILRSEHGL